MPLQYLPALRRIESEISAKGRKIMQGEQEKPVSPRRRIDAGTNDPQRYSYRDAEVLAEIPAIGQSEAKPLDPAAGRPRAGSSVTASANPTPLSSPTTKPDTITQPTLPPVTFPPGQTESRRMGENRIDQPHTTIAQQSAEHSAPSKAATVASPTNYGLDSKLTTSTVWIYRVAGLIIAALAIWFAISSRSHNSPRPTQILDGPNWPPQDLMRVADNPRPTGSSERSAGESVAPVPPNTVSLPMAEKLQPKSDSSSKLLPTALALSAPPTFDPELSKPPTGFPSTAKSTTSELQPPAAGPSGESSPVIANPAGTKATSAGSSDDYPSTDVRAYPDPNYQTNESIGDEFNDAREGAGVQLNRGIVPQKESNR